MIVNYEDPRKVFGKTVCNIADNDERIVLISADSGKSSGFGEFIETHPERYYELGIMEQTAVGVASGLATTGKIPVFCAIAPFVTGRPYEMFKNDLGYMRQNVKVIGRNGGISYSDLGSTHHSLDDFAIIHMIPGVTVLCPEDPNEIRAACAAMLAHEGPVYMRIGNSKIPNVLPEQPFIIGSARHICTGGDVTIICTGTVTAAAMKAAERLQSCGIAADVIGMPTVWPLDKEAVISSAKKTGRVVVAEEHYTDGGLGTMVADLLAAECPTRLLKLGIPNSYAISGPYDEVLAYYGLDSDGIAKSVYGFVKGS